MTFFVSCTLHRYAYSEDVSEEFDKDESTLTLIKPSPMPSKDGRSIASEPTRTSQNNNRTSDDDLEEDKTE